MADLNSGEVADEPPPQGLIVPLDVRPASADHLGPRVTRRGLDLKSQPYSSERQHDYVRLIVTCGLLLILGYLVVFATVESTSYPTHWAQTKEMLQIIMPALTGIIGTVIGFYFGTVAANQGQPPED